jgi:hypothetical protein
LRMHFVNYDKNNTIMVKRMVWYPEQRSSMWVGFSVSYFV